MAALWDLQRALRFAGDRLTLESGPPGSFLADAEQAAFRYFDTLPRGIREALEPDVRRPSSLEDSDALLDLARKLRVYLESEQAEAPTGTPFGSGGTPSGLGGRLAMRFSRAWSSLKES